MNAMQISELIGLIYETANDESLWPHLLERIAAQVDVPAETTLFADSHATNSYMSAANSSSDPAQTLLACLAPHFARAQDMNQQLRDVEEELESTHEFLDRLPLGMALIDREGGIVSINRSMLSVVSGKGLLRMEAGRLSSTPAHYLRDAIDRVFSGSAGDYSVRIEDGSGGKSISLLIIHRKGAANAAVLVASQCSQALSEKGLGDFFGLTAAESRVTQQLALGLTVEEAAQQLGIKLSTARTHVQRVFGKVGVGRQPDLLRAIFSSPLWLGWDASAKRSASGTGYVVSLPENDGDRFQLAGGRHMAYSDTGDRKGLPVMLMHPLRGSRHMRRSDESILRREGIRLIIPERPGNGDSEPCDKRTYLDWPNDVLELAEHLEIERFAVVGQSAGTPYALATSYALPQRVLALSIAAGVPPFRKLEDIRDYAPEFNSGLIVAKYAPALLPSLLRVVENGVRKNPYRYIERTLRNAADADRKVFADPTLRARYAAVLAGSAWQGFMPELMLLTNDWGFDLADIGTPCIVWHGEMDSQVAVTGAKRLVSAMPNAQLRMVSHAGHYVMFSHWDEILRDLKHRSSESQLRPSGVAGFSAAAALTPSGI
jgi:pimeloyl-ACP methyl ester carboxylesterase/DNA-binding CsgD family transcriptional regulator